MTKIMVELKAQIQDRESVREPLLKKGSEYVGRYHQIDFYFKVDRGRLKIRELVGLDNSQIIFYEREDIKGPKESKVWRTKVPDPDALKDLLSQVFPVCAVVNKEREIYMCNGIQVHLDKVESLGEFLEFEMEVLENTKSIQQGRRKIEDLLKKLNIDTQTLLNKSYCEMIMERESQH